MSAKTPPPDGTLALVRTPTFRCLGILRDGQWHNAYQTMVPLADVLDYEPLHGFDPLALGLSRPQIPLTDPSRNNDIAKN